LLPNTILQVFLRVSQTAIPFKRSLQLIAETLTKDQGCYIQDNQSIIYSCPKPTGEQFLYFVTGGPPLPALQSAPLHVK